MYYVYVLARPNGKPFYVGKGRGNRMYLHDTEARSGCRCHKCNVIRKIWRNGGKVVRYVVFNTKDELEAFAYEREMIALFGRENLTNQTDGGEGPSGRKAKPSEIRRRTLSIRRTMSDPIRRARWRASIEAYHKTPEAKARKSESMRRFYRSEIGRAAASARSQQTWSDPEKRERIVQALRAAVTTSEYRAKKSVESLERWADPEYRARVAAAIKEGLNSPEYREAARQRMIARYTDPEERRRQGERARESHANPEVRQRISERTKAALSRPEERARLSKTSLEKWQDPEFRKKISQANQRANGTAEKRLLFSNQQKAYRATDEGREAARRAAKIMAQNKAKLTRAQGEEIRLLWETGKYRQKDLAQQYNVGQSTIWRLLKSPETFNYKEDSD